MALHIQYHLLILSLKAGESLRTHTLESDHQGLQPISSNGQLCGLTQLLTFLYSLELINNFFLSVLGLLHRLTLVAVSGGFSLWRLLSLWSTGSRAGSFSSYSTWCQ